MMASAEAGSDVISGTVTGPLGEPVPDAKIELYPFDAGAGAMPLETQSDESGQYEFESLTDETIRNEYIINPTETVIIARYHDWFWTTSGDLEPYLGSTLDVSLENQRLYGPKIAESSWDEGTQESLLTAWRTVHGTGRQTLYLEITNVRDYLEEEPYEILAAQGDLVSGTFAVTVSRDAATINFGSQSDFQDDTASPVLVLARPNQVENPELEYWHPVRTNLPLFGIGGGNVKISSTDFEEVESLERIKDGIGSVAGGLPVLGAALAVVDAIDFAVGAVLEREASLGNLDVGFPDPRDPNQLVNFPDPNTHTTAYQSWHLPSEAVGGVNQNAGSVVMQAPLQFNEGVDTVRVTAHAEWMHPYAHVTFGEKYELSKLDTPIAEETGPTVVGTSPAKDLDGDGAYEDVNGDGSFNIVDVNALMENRATESVQDNSDLFDFNNDGSTNIIDVSQLLRLLND